MTAINCRSLYADAGAAMFGSDFVKPLKCSSGKGDITVVSNNRTVGCNRSWQWFAVTPALPQAAQLLLEHVNNMGYSLQATGPTISNYSQSFYFEYSFNITLQFFSLP